jgi:hypothetical protein
MGGHLAKEEELLRGGRNASTAAAPRARGTTWRRLQPQRDERTLGPEASHLIERHTSKRSVCADI